MVGPGTLLFANDNSGAKVVFVFKVLKKNKTHTQIFFCIQYKKGGKNNGEFRYRKTKKAQI